MYIEEKPINYFVRNRSSMIHYVLYVDEPRTYSREFPYNFIYWRRQVDLLCPYRVSSVLNGRVKNRRQIKYIFDQLVDMIQVEKKIQKVFPACRLKSCKHIISYDLS
jgi:hypothetical protein